MMKVAFLLVSICLLVFLSSNTAAADDKDKSACVLPQEVGPCRGSKIRYFFDNESKACKEFFYGGCMGNDNNFETVEECQKLCATA